jgi:hypothetical protein
VRQAERDHGLRAGPSSEERDRIRALEPAVREIRQATEFLRKASAYFGMAEFDRRSKPRSSTITARRMELSRSARSCRSPLRRLVGSAFELTDLGETELKVIAEPVHVWRVERALASDSRFEARQGGGSLTPLVGREEEIGLLLRR